MSSMIDSERLIVAKARDDPGFRSRLLANPKGTIEAELGVTLPADQEIRVHEETDNVTHLVLPVPSEFSEEEREAARNGVASLDFLRKTMYDPAPPIRKGLAKRRPKAHFKGSAEVLAQAARESISLGLDFLQSSIDENGAWHCIRFNIADPEVPRHYERPAFVSAVGVLALRCSADARARQICARTKSVLVDGMEHPGLWRYYRHLPADLDSTALCSLVLTEHPWIVLRRNAASILANRDDVGRFTTWVLAHGEPDVVAPFRIEADPVVNANVIAYLGDHPETKQAQDWLHTLITEGSAEGSSKWYPDLVSLYYATARAIVCSPPALDELRPVLDELVFDLRDGSGGFGNVLQTAQALSSLYNMGSLNKLDVSRQIDLILGSQHDDGSWPELLAYGDQSLSWGLIGQFGHASESVTTALCIEALTYLEEMVRK